MLYGDIISTLQCAVVANSSVIQTAWYRHLTILAPRYIVSSVMKSLLVSSRLVSRYFSLPRYHKYGLG